MLSYVFSFPATLGCSCRAADRTGSGREALGAMLSLRALRCTKHNYQQAQIPGWKNALQVSNLGAEQHRVKLGPVLSKSESTE